MNYSKLTHSEFLAQCYTQSQIETAILDYTGQLAGLRSGKIAASRIIGKSLKAPKKQAELYLLQSIKDYQEALIIKTR